MIANVRDPEILFGKTIFPVSMAIPSKKVLLTHHSILTTCSRVGQTPLHPLACRHTFANNDKRYIMILFAKVLLPNIGSPHSRLVLTLCWQGCSNVNSEYTSSGYMLGACM